MVKEKKIPTNTCHCMYNITVSKIIIIVYQMHLTNVLILFDKNVKPNSWYATFFIWEKDASCYPFALKFREWIFKDLMVNKI